MSEFREKCQLEDVAAYLDGELSQAGVNHFEDHLKSCSDCVAELRAQRQLLCTLEVAFNGNRSFELPHNFTRIVTARAESDLSGMRNKRERRRALKLCAGLALVSFALLGAAARTVVLDPLSTTFRISRTVLQLAWRAASELVISATVLGRVIVRAVLLEQNGLGWLMLVAFVIAVSVLPFLLVKYHRAQTIE